MSSLGSSNVRLQKINSNRFTKTPMNPPRKMHQIKEESNEGSMNNFTDRSALNSLVQIDDKNKRKDRKTHRNMASKQKKKSRQSKKSLNI